MKTGWFIGHRLREAMREGGLTPMGRPGEIVEVDETSSAGSRALRSDRRTAQARRSDAR